MRYAQSDTIKVNQAAVVDNATTGDVSYGWTAGDINTAGEFYAWFRVDPPTDTTFDTPEFLIVVREHAPGQRTRTGVIAYLTRSFLPSTYDALENSDKYGDALIQARIESVKRNLFGATVSVSEEDDYDIRVQHFAAKLAAIDLIPAGVDYWMDQRIMISATGTNETTSYPDRIAALWKVYERLTIQVAQERPEIEILLNTVSTNIEGVPGVTDGAGTGEREFKTPHSKDFFDYSTGATNPNQIFTTFHRRFG